MEKQTGVYITTRKDGTTSYRASITIKNKHISLGSYNTLSKASAAYTEALQVYRSACTIDSYSSKYVLPFKKYVSLINLRDNGIYFKTPIYLYKKYFIYYIGRNSLLKFDADDLFYYSTHSIMQRGGRLFVADYGMQVGILSRYGIKEYAVPGRDYFFANGDNTDYRYGNIIIVNKYHGVQQFVKKGRNCYKVKIHINGDYVVGTYSDEDVAAVAYNKAVHILKANGCKKDFPENYPESLTAIAYASIYNSVKISAKVRNYKSF